MKTRADENALFLIFLVKMAGAVLKRKTTPPRKAQTKLFNYSKIRKFPVPIKLPNFSTVMKSFKSIPSTPSEDTSTNNKATTALHARLFFQHRLNYFISLKG